MTENTSLPGPGENPFEAFLFIYMKLGGL